MKSLLVRIERYNAGKGKLAEVWDLAKEYEKKIKELVESRNYWRKRSLKLEKDTND